MTVKEFEEQKDAIVNELNGIDPTQCHVDYAILKIRQLQPPRPTCDSCKYLLDDKIHDYECNAWGKSGQAISDMAGNYLSDPDDNNRIDFGCIHHSDYDKVKK